MIVSIHLPKTAGSSFQRSLKEHYGDKLLLAYDDEPMSKPIIKRNVDALKGCLLNTVTPAKNIDCIHGHFMPLKYRFCKQATLITWMRNPAERLASLYYYWLRTEFQQPHIILKKFKKEKWSLERLCLGPEFRNFYSQYLWGINLKHFDFIGITEFYETELTYFSKHYIGTELQAYNKNTNPSKRKTSYFEDKTLKKRIEQYHQKDMSLYQRALEIRRTRTIT